MALMIAMAWLLASRGFVFSRPVVATGHLPVAILKKSRCR